MVTLLVCAGVDSRSEDSACCRVLAVCCSEKAVCCSMFGCSFCMCTEVDSGVSRRAAAAVAVAVGGRGVDTGAANAPSSGCADA